MAIRPRPALVEGLHPGICHRRLNLASSQARPAFGGKAYCIVAVFIPLRLIRGFPRSDGHLRQLHVQRIDFLQTNIPQRKHRTVGCEAGPPSEAARDQRASLDQIRDVLQPMVGEANAI
jgi:hypothetical protein